MNQKLAATPSPEWEECQHCHGYGSSLKDPQGVDQCTRCHPFQGNPGWMPGLVPRGTQNA